MEQRRRSKCNKELFFVCLFVCFLSCSLGFIFHHALKSVKLLFIIISIFALSFKLCFQVLLFMHLESVAPQTQKKYP